MVVLKHRNPIKAIFWFRNSPVGWLPDTKSKGTGFDSRSCRDHFFTFLGMSWDVFGSTLGVFSDGWGKEKNVENRGRKSGSEIRFEKCQKSNMSKVSGGVFPASRSL